MEVIEVEGRTVEDAIAAACQQLNQPREMLEVEVVTPGSTGIFGFVGARKARIRVRVKGAAAPPAHATAAEAPAAEQRRPSRRRRHRGPRQAATAAAQAAGAEVEAAPPAREQAEEAAEEPAPPPRPEEPLVAEEFAAAAREVCAQIVAGLGYDTVEVKAQRLPGEVRLELDGEEAQALIGHRGDVLHALQHIVSKIANRQAGSRVPVTIDVEGWRARRNQALEELAAKLARKAKESGKPVAMNPMNAQDRRVVHLALQQDGELTTKSRGEGALRKVVIFPRKARRRGNRKNSQGRHNHSS